MIAAVAAGLVPDLAAACADVTSAARDHSIRAPSLDEAYERYRRVVRQIAPLW